MEIFELKFASNVKIAHWKNHYQARFEKGASSGKNKSEHN